MIDFLPLSYYRQNPWDSKEPWSKLEKTPLWLLTPEEVKSLPAGVHLTSINGDVRITSHDYIDLDTRFGYTAWGVYREDFEHAIQGT